MNGFSYREEMCARSHALSSSNVHFSAVTHRLRLTVDTSPTGEGYEMPTRKGET